MIPLLPPVILNSVLPYFQHTGRLQHLVDGGLRVLPPGEDSLALSPVWRRQSN